MRAALLAAAGRAFSAAFCTASLQQPLRGRAAFSSRRLRASFSPLFAHAAAAASASAARGRLGFRAGRAAYGLLCSPYEGRQAHDIAAS